MRPVRINRCFRIGIALVAFFATVLLLAAPAVPEGVKTLKPGDQAPDFNLPGVDGKNHTLAEYSDSEILAVLFTCNHCPSAQGAESRFKKLEADYKNKSFQMIAISPNDPNSPINAYL